MGPENALTCLKCNASAAPGAVFCTNCGARFSEPAPTGDVTTISSPEAPNQSPVTRCTNCSAVLEPHAMFCTACGTRVSSGEKNPVDTPPTTSPILVGSPTATVESTTPTRAVPSSLTPVAADAASQTAAAPAKTPAVAFSDVAQVPKVENVSEQLGQHRAPTTGWLAIIGLLLVVGISVAVLWLRPSTTASNHVIILAPQHSTINVEPNSTVQVGISVHGDGGAGLSWRIAENYGGTIKPAGVTVQGSMFIYHATYQAGGTPGEYHIVATSSANRASEVSILVHVQQ